MQRIQSKPQLASRIEKLLQGSGMTLSEAAAGFSNQGRFIAALHVSQNHPAIKFTDLRTEMIDNHLSLGQSIQKLSKSVDATTATAEAERQAQRDLAADSSTTGSTGTTTSAAGTTTTAPTARKTKTVKK